MAGSGIQSCAHCEGFIPVNVERCPHCDAQRPAHAPAGLSLRAKIASGLLASSAAMTLMACYGAPCGPDGCGPGPDVTQPETSCDASTKAQAVAESTLPLTLEGELRARPGTSHASCGGNGDELVYTWTPPAAGEYEVSVVGTTGNTVVYARTPDASGGNCGQELACNTDAESSNSAITLSVTSTEPVLLVVDSVAATDAGKFTLSIKQR